MTQIVLVGEVSSGYNYPQQLPSGVPVTIRVPFKLHNGAVVSLRNPQVIMSIKDVDASHNENLRIKLYANGIDNNGFNANFETWADSAIYNLVASFVVVGDA